MAEAGAGAPELSERDARLAACVLALHRRLAATAPDRRTTSAIAEAVADETLALIDAEDCVVALLAEPGSDRLVIAAGSGPWAPTIVGATFPLDGSFSGRAITAARPLESTDIAAEAGAPAVFGSSGIQTARVLPFLVGEPLPDGRRALGALAVYRRGRRPFSAEEAALVDEWAAVAGGELVASELRAFARRDATRSEGALGVATQVAGTLDSAEVLRRLAATTLGAVDADRVSVLRRVADGLEIVAGADVDPTAPETVGRVYRQQPAWLEVLRSREAVVDGVFDASEVGTGLRPIADSLRHDVAVPLVTGGEVLGILNTARRREPAFTRGEVETLLVIARIAALALHNAELHESVQDATREAQSLERLKSQFLRLASHELRGPVAVARGYVSMITEGSLGELPDPLRHILPIVALKLEESNDLIDEMLETARLEDGAIELSVRDEDLASIAGDTSRLATLPERGRVTVSGAGPLPIRADRRRLATAVHNLVGNALKYSTGPVEVLVRAEGGEGVVEVRDQGPGIAASDMPRLFTRFGRIVTPENSHIGGTGLGLYLSREIARLHGGDITAVSDPVSGSVFALRVPLTRTPPGAPPEAT